MMWSKILRMDENSKDTSRKTYEMAFGTQSFNVDILGANRQFHWTKISLVFGKSNKHTTIYGNF